jgi:hypothetical protein
MRIAIAAVAMTVLMGTCGLVRAGENLI